MPSFTQMSDSDMLTWMDNFVTVANANPTMYGVTVDQIKSLQTKAEDLRQKIAARVTAEDAAKAAVRAQAASREAAEPEVAYLNTIIKANPNVTGAEKQAVGIDVPKPRTKSAPVTPTDLIANGFQDGRNTLKWNRAGNKPNTQFIIECKREADAQFGFLATTTETKYEQRGAKPGERCIYRVKAQRGGEESTYSNDAMVY